MFGFTLLFLMHLAAGIIVPAIIFFVKGIKAGGKRRQAAIYVAVSIACIIIGAVIKFSYDINHVIGTYNGQILQDMTFLMENYDNDYSASDKGHYLGSVVYIDQNDYKTDPKFVWEIKGTDEYIYVLFAYDGTIYKRVD